MPALFKNINRKMNRDEIVNRIIDLKGRRIGMDFSYRKSTIEEEREISALQDALILHDERDRLEFSKILSKIKSIDHA